MNYAVDISEKTSEDRKLEQKTKEFTRDFNWKMYRYQVKRHLENGKTIKRTVDVLCPLYSAAEIGIGSTEDETVRSVNAAPLKTFRSLTPRKSELAAFYESMAQSLDMQMDLSSAVKLAIPFATTPSWRGTLGCIYKGLMEGLPLSTTLSAFPQTFSPETIAIVRAGESSPSEMPEIFEKLSSRTGNESEQLSKIKTIFIYPSVIMAMSIALSIFISMVAVPKLTDLFNELGAPLPGSVILIKEVGEFLVQYGLYLLPALIVLAIVLKGVFARALRSRTVNRLLLKLPVTGKLQQYLAIVRSLNTYSALKRTEVDTRRLLTLTAKSSGNPVFEEFYMAILNRVKDGGGAIEDGFRKERHRLGKDGDYISAKCSLGSKTISTDEVFAKVAKEYENKLNDYVSQLPKLLQMPLTVISFVPVAFMAISIGTAMPKLIIHTLNQING